MGRAKGLEIRSTLGQIKYRSEGFQSNSYTLKLRWNHEPHNRASTAYSKLHSHEISKLQFRAHWGTCNHAVKQTSTVCFGKVEWWLHGWLHSCQFKDPEGHLLDIISNAWVQRVVTAWLGICGVCMNSSIRKLKNAANMYIYIGCYFRFCDFDNDVKEMVISLMGSYL